jgi:MFS family permease
MVMLFCIVSSASVTNFFPTVVQTLKYPRVESLLLTAPPYVLAVITAFINAWHADRTGERYFHTTLPLYIAVIAFIIAATTTATAPRYLAMMLMPPGIYTGERLFCRTNSFDPVITMDHSPSYVDHSFGY